MVPHSDEVAWTRTPFESDCPQNHPVVNLLFGIAVAIGLLTTIELMPGIFLSEAILLLCGVLVVAGSRSRGFTRCAAFHWTMVPMIAAVAWVMLALLVSPEPVGPQSLREVVSQWLLRVALVVSGVMVLTSSRGAAQSLVRASTVVVLVYGVVVVAVAIRFGDWSVLRRGGEIRMPPVFGLVELGNANWIAQSVLMSLPFAVWGTRHSACRVLAMLVLAGVVIAVSRSRLGTAFYLIECVAALMLVPMSRRSKVVLTAASIATLVIAAQQVLDRVSQGTVASDPGRMTIREALLQASIPLIVERPLCGWGIGRAEILVNSSRVLSDTLASQSYEGPIAMHNNFLLYSVESGVPVALLVLGGMSALAVEAWVTSSRRREPCRSFGRMSVVALVLVLASMQTAVVYRQVMMWVTVAAAVLVASGFAGPFGVPYSERGSRQRGRVEVAPPTVPIRRDDER